MHRSISVHPLSLALGLALGVVCLLSMSQVTTTTPLRVEYLAHPRDMIQIKSGTPFTVPAGKVFVATAVGNVGGNSGARAFIRVNGAVEATGNGTTSVGQLWMESVPSGFTAPAGSIIDVTWSNGVTDPYLEQRAWGYLVNQ